MKILFIDSAHPSLKWELEKNGFICDEDFNSPKEEIQKKLSSYRGIVMRSRFTIDRQFIDCFAPDSAPQGERIQPHRFVARIGAGMEHIDVVYAKSKGIACISSPEGNRNAVAEHSLGMLLTLFNNICKANSEVKAGQWFREANRATELEGKTVGIYGYGNTGSAFAKLLYGFDVKILAFDKYKKGFSNEFVTEATPGEIFAQADVLSLHLPLTEETKYLLNDTFFNEFRKSIYLINTSRGPIVNTNDLVKNLKSGKVAGACLDVIEYEESSFEAVSPISAGTSTWNLQPGTSDSWKYLRASNHVILTPHIAGWSFESSVKMARILAERIISLKYS